MDNVKPCGCRCSGATSQRYDACLLCGSLTPVVYFPIPVPIPALCKECQKNGACCQGLRVEQFSRPDEEEEARQDNVKCTCSKVKENSASDKAVLACACCSVQQQSDPDKQAEEVNNNCDIYYKLCFCNGKAHFVKITFDQNGSISFPKAGVNCARDHIAETGHCQCQKNTDSIRAIKAKTAGCECTNNCTVHRRLSADSGRVTWSDSGESIISDNQPGENSKWASVAAAKTTVSTSQSQYVLSPAISVNEPSSKETTYSKNTEYLSHESDQTGQEQELNQIYAHGKIPDSQLILPARRFHSVVEATARNFPLGTHSTHCSWDEHNAAPITERQIPLRESGKGNMRLAKSSVQFAATPSSPAGPKRSSSDWALRMASKSNAKPARTQLDSLTERDAIMTPSNAHIPRRPRSKSLFIGAGSRGGNRSFLLPTRRSTPSETCSYQVSEADFTDWKAVTKSWEIGGDCPGKECIKAYDIAAVPNLQGLALTHANKIKIYGTDGQMKHHFGTPTWPMFGRGISLSRSGNQLAVCHLSEICNYTLEGTLIGRYSHEMMKACWGIACDTEGNFVITDPKTSSIFLLTPAGELVRLIGESNSVPKSPTRKRSTSSRSWKKSHVHRSQSTGKIKSQLDGQKNVDETNQSSVTAAHTALRKTSSSNEAEKKKVRLLTPRYVAVNSKNQILITDAQQRCLLAFEKDGTLLFSIGGGRAGCGKCVKGKDEEPMVYNLLPNRDLIPTAPPVMVPTRSTSVHGRMGDAILGKPTPRLSEESSNYLKELCGQACLSKSGKLKLPGATYRAHLARGESAESHAYEATPCNQLEELKVIEADLCEQAIKPSYTAANRLGTHLHEMPMQYSSCTDIPSEQHEEKCKLSLTKSMVKLVPKNMRKSGWWKSRNRKKLQIWTSEIGRCESLTSMSCGASRYNSEYPDDDSDSSYASLSPTTKSEQTHDTKAISSRYSCEKSPSSPRADSECSVPSLPTSPTVNLNSGEVFGHSDSCDSFQEVEEGPVYDENEETMACRRCHVEDPRGICVDKNDNILVVDRARHRVTVFNSEGHFMYHLLTENDGLSYPMAVCIVGRSTIAVTDSSASVKLFEFAKAL